MRAYLLAAAATAMMVFAAVPASAQFGVYVGPGGGGVYVDPGRRAPPPRYYDDDYRDWRVSRNEAVRIARRNGMREVWDVDRRGRYWVVRGENRNGRRVTMRIDRNGGWGWN